MAVQKIAFPVVFRKNENKQSLAYGKYYLEAYRPDTLSLKGMLARVAFDQSVYSTDIVEGVISKITTVMVELLESGQPVKWDGFGTFTPGVENVSGGITQDKLMKGDYNADKLISGVHINFVPENTKGQKLTSRAFKDLCVFNIEGVIVPEKITGEDGKVKEVFNKLVPMDTWVHDNTQEADGGNGGD